MQVLAEGQGELVGWHDPDENRKWVLENKPMELKEKVMSAKEAVSKFVHDGDIFVSGGFGHVRISMNIAYEMIRQGKRDLTMISKTSVQDLDLLVAAGCVNQVETSYTFGHELRGLSTASRRAAEEGRCKIRAENTNVGLQWRFLAAMMGIPFIPSRNILGTDLFKHSSAKMVKDPFSGKPICLLPACYPDVAVIHTHRSDVYGNCQIDGIVIEDFEIARAARRLIITTEEIIDHERIRAEPWRTVIPYYLVDAVVECPFASHPCNMPYLYYFDEEMMGEWLNTTETDEGVKQFLDKYVFSVNDFDEYLTLIGGMKKLTYLREIERLRAPQTAPWLERRKK